MGVRLSSRLYCRQLQGVFKPGLPVANVAKPIYSQGAAAEVMRKQGQKRPIRIIKCVLWPIGFLLIAVWIYGNWAEPSIIGFDRQLNDAEGAAQIWAVRLLYIYFLLFAVYRSYAELGDRIDLPYELWAASLAFFVPLLLVMAMVQFHWFV